MVVWLSLIVFGILGFVACWIAFEGYGISNRRAENFFGCLAIVGIVCFLIGTLGSIAQDDKNREKKEEEQDKAVMQVCYPRVATNVNEGDSRITFDCANDGKLHVVKK